MFSPDIVESDAFLEMPSSSQALYFHLGMYADDDGFVNPKKIMRMMSASDDDLKVLSAKRFVLPFENGVVVIKHWRINNLIRKDWYKETQYLEQKSKLRIKENGAYTDSVNEPLTKPTHRLGKVRLGKVRLGTTTPASPESKKKKEPTNVQEIVNYFFELKGWNDKPKEFYQKNKILYGRFVKPSSQILELCDQNVSYAKDRVNRIFLWADSNSLDWSLETVIKKFLDIDKLREREKKPTWQGNPMYKRGGRMFVIMPNGEHKEFTNKHSEIVYA
jgi:hypothetical protein